MPDKRVNLKEIAMTVTLDLNPEVEKGLLSRAHARGVSLDDYLQELVAKEANSPQTAEPLVEKPLQTAAEIVLSCMRNVPPEIMAKMPVDGASQHDHYIYGWPKKEA